MGPEIGEVAFGAKPADAGVQKGVIGTNAHG